MFVQLVTDLLADSGLIRHDRDLLGELKTEKTEEKAFDRPFRYDGATLLAQPGGQA